MPRWPLRMWMFVLMTAVGGAASALMRAEPSWQWLGFVVTLAGAIGAGYAPSPTQAKRLEWHERELAALSRSVRAQTKDTGYTKDTGSGGKTP